jgi:3-dehydrotetronate 4-kinase
VLVTPAFPETQRTVYSGNLFVGQAPLNESPMKDHPLNPMRDANLVRVLGRQCRGKVGLADLFTVSGGPGRLRARLAGLAASGHVAAIADAVFERDLEIIGEVAAQERFSTGASGLGLGLARALVKTGRVAGGTADVSAVLQPVGGLAAILAGSCSRATLDQVEAAEKSMPVLRLDPELLADGRGEGEIARALSWARERVTAAPVLIATSAEPEAVARVQQIYGRDSSGRAIEQAMASIAKGLLDAGVRRLIVAGGETAGAVVGRLGIPAFQVGPEIAPGVPVLRPLGYGKLELLMALKSGNFGGPDFFENALGIMK